MVAKSKAGTKGRKKVQVKDLSKSERKLPAKQMKNVKGGDVKGGKVSVGEIQVSKQTDIASTNLLR
jgi:hypothetical protein